MMAMPVQNAVASRAGLNPDMVPPQAAPIAAPGAMPQRQVMLNAPAAPAPGMLPPQGAPGAMQPPQAAPVMTARPLMLGGPSSMPVRPMAPSMEGAPGMVPPQIRPGMTAAPMARPGMGMMQNAIRARMGLM